MVVGGGGCGGVRGVVVLVVVVLGVVLGGCGGVRLPRSPLHTRALQNSILPPSSAEEIKPDTLSRYPGQDDYISEYWPWWGEADVNCVLFSFFFHLFVDFSLPR